VGQIFFKKNEIYNSYHFHYIAEIRSDNLIKVEDGLSQLQLTRFYFLCLDIRRCFFSLFIKLSKANFFFFVFLTRFGLC
jgi:hypothetical protein